MEQLHIHRHFQTRGHNGLEYIQALTTCHRSSVQLFPTQPDF